MFRSASRGGALLFRAASTSAATTTGRSTGFNRIAAAQRRLISTAPPAQKSRSWRNRFIRLGLAGAAVYYYNTSTVFAEEPALSLRPQPLEDENAPTLESLTSSLSSSKRPPQTTSTQSSSVAVVEPTTTQQPSEDGLEGLESQADQEGAFNPETGEINWDCPCLGGMAHGPCGEDFKAAFSCFVYSTEEPKGMDCIEKFKGMQDCFRLHPDVYGSELEEDEVDEQLQEHIASGGASDDNKPLPAEDYSADPAAASLNASEKRAEANEIRAQVQDAHEQAQKEEELVPKAWHNTTDQNGESKKTEK